MIDDYSSAGTRTYGPDTSPDWYPPPPPQDFPPPLPPRRRDRFPRWLIWGVRVAIALLVLVVVWLTITAPLSQSLQPRAAPTISVLAAGGEVIARRGARIDEPVDVRELPPHVAQAFIAIEDRRFFRHLGVDPWGLARAMARNVGAGGMVQGGSTITQQLAKTSFTGGRRTAGRKIQEAFIALWLEAWLSKEEILGRYLSNVYFGDNVYGLRAASEHYFSVPPEEMSVEQAAMLAAVVNAPSRLAPSRNLRGAQARARLVLRSMTDAGYLTERQFRASRPARLRMGRRDEVPTGTYFADWVLAEANRGEDEDETYGETEIQTTLDLDLQRLAERAVRSAPLGRAQAALVAMRTNGDIVAMVGGRNYSQNAFNRVTQARRQPGSTFKLFVYLAALRNGWRLDSAVDDSPLQVGDWRPENYEQRYRGRISLLDAFTVSSNTAAVRVAQSVGLNEVIRAARDLGVTSPLPSNASLPLGTAGTSLLEMTAAYAAVAADRYPVRPRGLDEEAEQGWLGGWLGGGGGTAVPAQRDPAFAPMRDLLNSVVMRGTGTGAALAVPTFGKTGTTQDYRDALFIGFAGDLVVGVWIGNDDNSPLPGVTGGALPARIWRTFMTGALNTQPAAPRQIQPVVVPGLDANLAQPYFIDPYAPVEAIPGELIPLPPGQYSVDQGPPPEQPLPDEPAPDQPPPFNPEQVVRPPPARQPPLQRQPVPPRQLPPQRQAEEPPPFTPQPAPESEE